MPHAPSIASLLKSLKTSSEILKVIWSRFSSLHKAELKLKLAELMESLAESKMQAVEVQEELDRKNDQIKRLKDMVSSPLKIVPYGKDYYVTVSDPKARRRPCCKQCWESDCAVIALFALADGRHGCGRCKTMYKGIAPPPMSPTLNEDGSVANAVAVTTSDAAPASV